MATEINTHPEIADKRERSLLIGHEAVDKLRIREIGKNAGFWVQKILASVGLGKGYAWCAAFVYWQLILAGVPKSSLPKHGASVRGWFEWAEATGRLLDKATWFDKIERGDVLFWLDDDDPHGGGEWYGHLMRFIRWFQKPVDFETFEGNTNAKGSREGDGAYRKTRLVAALKQHDKWGAISLKGIK